MLFCSSSCFRFTLSINFFQLSNIDQFVFVDCSRWSQANIAWLLGVIISRTLNSNTQQLQTRALIRLSNSMHIRFFAPLTRRGLIWADGFWISILFGCAQNEHGVFCCRRQRRRRVRHTAEKKRGFGLFSESNPKLHNMSRILNTDDVCVSKFHSVFYFGDKEIHRRLSSSSELRGRSTVWNFKILLSSAKSSRRWDGWMMCVVEMEKIHGRQRKSVGRRASEVR